MDTRHLKYFLDVANTLNFTKAAQMNHVVQTTMSQNILFLENQLGFKLFERNNRSVKLTKMGEVFYEDAERILRATEQAEIHMNHLALGKTGVLRIGYQGDHEMQFFPELLKAYRKLYPEIALEFRQGFPSNLGNLLHDSSCDLIFTLKDENDIGNYSDWVVSKQQLCLVVPKEHKLAELEMVEYTDFVGEPMIFFHPSCGNGTYSMMIHECIQGGYKPILSGYATTAKSLLLMVELGSGITILPESCNVGHNGSIRFIPINGSPKLVLVARWLKNNDNPSLKNFVDILKAQFPNGLI